MCESERDVPSCCSADIYSACSSEGRREERKKKKKAAFLAACIYLVALESPRKSPVFDLFTGTALKPYA